LLNPKAWEHILENVYKKLMSFNP